MCPNAPVTEQRTVKRTGWIAWQDEEEDDDAASVETIKSHVLGNKHKKKKPHPTSRGPQQWAGSGRNEGLKGATYVSYNTSSPFGWVGQPSRQ